MFLMFFLRRLATESLLLLLYKMNKHMILFIILFIWPHMNIWYCHVFHSLYMDVHSLPWLWICTGTGVRGKVYFSSYILAPSLCHRLFSAPLQILIDRAPSSLYITWPDDIIWYRYFAPLSQTNKFCQLCGSPRCRQKHMYTETECTNV